MMPTLLTFVLFMKNSNVLLVFNVFIPGEKNLFHVVHKVHCTVDH